MKKYYTALRLVLVFTAILLCGSPLQAQSAKPKPTPKPKATPVKTLVAAAEPRPNSPLGALETEIFTEIGNLRADPASYVRYLEQMKPKFNGTSVMLSDGTRLITNEGAAAVADAIATLKNTRPLAAFKFSPGLAKAAAQHLQDLIKNNLSGHKGSDGSWPPNRVDRYGFWSLEVKENISYRAQSAREIVLNMLIDDGNPKREHRKNLLSSNLRFAGLNVGEGKTYGRLCVVVFAGEFTEKRTGK